MADWNKILSRGNIEDRRASPAAIGGGLGVAGIAITLLLSVLTGTTPDIGSILTRLQGVQTTSNSAEFEGSDQYEAFASTVIGSTNEYWRQQFSAQNRTYQEPKLVLFRSVTPSGCGMATSDVGPHYCPADGTIYLDETFFSQMQLQLNARGGDVAEAYVIAHEVGHHVQNQLGVFNQLQASGNSNEDSIRTELQADCYAGSWAHSIADLGIFEAGEIGEAIDAASAVGDDRIQSSVNGQVSPETWTHGSSEQRVQWFTTGFESGDPVVCRP